MDISISKKHIGSYNELMDMGFRLVGARQTWHGLYLMSGRPCPDTTLGELPTLGQNWQSSDKHYSLSEDGTWATMYLNCYSGSEYPVIGYFFRKL